MKHQAKLPTARIPQAVISLSSGNTELVIRSLNWMWKTAKELTGGFVAWRPSCGPTRLGCGKIAAAADDATGRR